MLQFEPNVQPAEPLEPHFAAEVAHPELQVATSQALPFLVYPVLQAQAVSTVIPHPVHVAVE